MEEVNDPYEGWKFSPYTNEQELINSVLNEIYGGDSHTFKFYVCMEYQKNQESYFKRGYNGTYEKKYVLEIYNSVGKIMNKYTLLYNYYFNCCGIGNISDYLTDSLKGKFGEVLPFLVCLIANKGLITLSLSKSQKAAYQIACKLQRFFGGQSIEFHNINSGNDVYHFQIGQIKCRPFKIPPFITKEYYTKHYGASSGKAWVYDKYAAVDAYKQNIVKTITEFKNANQQKS